MIAFGAAGDHLDIYVTPIDGGPVALVAGTGDDEIRLAGQIRFLHVALGGRANEH